MTAAALTSLMTKNLQFAETHITQTVTIGGTAYVAVVTDTARGEVLDMAGIYPERSITVTMRTATKAAPEIGFILTFGGREFRIISAKDCADGISYELGCDALHK